jgi:hypothetical protein
LRSGYAGAIICSFGYGVPRAQLAGEAFTGISVSLLMSDSKSREYLVLLYTENPAACSKQLV